MLLSLAKATPRCGDSRILIQNSRHEASHWH